MLSDEETKDLPRVYGTNLGTCYFEIILGYIWVIWLLL